MLGKEAGAPAGASEDELCKTAGVKKALLVSLTLTGKDGKLKASGAVVGVAADRTFFLSRGDFWGGEALWW